MPFFPRVLVHLVGLRHRPLQPPLVPEPPGQVLEQVAQVKQFPAVAAQLAGEPRGGHPLGEPPEDQDQLDGPPLGRLQGRPGEGIEHPVTGRAAVVQHRGTVAAVDAQAVARPAPRAGHAVVVQPVDELGVAGALVHQIRDGEVHG
jgi:hypothetical protein